MSNLSPEKRLDKNGRMVTRHVKTGSSAPGAGRIPKPQIAARDASEDRKLVISASPKYMPVFMEKVKAASPELVKRLNGFYERHHKSKLTREIADQTIKIVEAAKSTRDTLRYVDNLSTHLDYVRTLGCGDENGIMLINGLIDAEDRVTGPLSERQQQAVMLVTKAMVIDYENVDRMEDFELRVRHGMYHFALTDHDLVRMAAEDPENADKVAGMITVGVIRPGQIKAALDDNVQRPLLGGAL